MTLAELLKIIIKMIKGAFVISILSAATSVYGLDQCWGMTPINGDNRCNYDDSHVVCAQLLHKSWNYQGDSFYEILDQRNSEDYVTREMQDNGGNSYCIDMWALAEVINRVGCDNAHIVCSATNEGHALNLYAQTGDFGFKAFHCLQAMCHGDF